MITSLPIFIFGTMFRIIGFIGAGLKILMPLWLNDGISWIMNGAGIINAFLPMYPHAEMTGLAHELGIMTIFGWALIMAAYAVEIVIIWWAVSFFVAILPWSTHSTKAPHKLN